MTARAGLVPLLVVGLWVVGSCGSGATRPPVFADLVIVTDTLASGTLGSTYSKAVHAEGGDGAYTWAQTAGTLPPGLALSVDDLGDGEHAIISGIPDQAGNFQFTLTVTSGDGQSASQAFTVRILPAVAVSIQTPIVPPALAGASYDVGLKATGGDGQTYEWAVVEGRLPDGLVLSTAGRIQGTPTAPDTAVFTAEVRSAGLTRRRAYTLPVVPNQPGSFNITIFPVADIPAGVRPHLEEAVAEWERAITANLLPITIPTGFFSPEHCGGFGELVNGTSTDDLLLIINIEPIDGPGGVLGRAGPCGLRSQTELPFAGSMVLDFDDLTPLIGDDRLTFIISHEIAHVLGFGTIWGRLGLIQGTGTSDPRFVGPSAVAEYNALGGEGSVPVENQGGPGTRDGHWRQTTFRHERMTGFSAGAGIFQPLSRVSIASFSDKGYVVDMAAAHSFTLTAALRAGEHGHDWGDLGYDEILRDPVRILYPDGRGRTVNPH